MYTNCHSYYSLRYGTISEVELLKMAEENDIKYLALTDINSTTAVLNFLKESKYFNVWPVVGVDFRNGVEQKYVILARNNKGFLNINRFLSKHLHDKTEFPSEAPQLGYTYVIYPFEKVLELEKIDFQKNEFIGISVRNLNRLLFSKYKNYTEKLVVQQPVTFRSQSDFNAHRLLRCIDLNILLSKLPQSEQADTKHRMLHKEVLLETYAEHPYIMETTKKILQKCKLDFFFEDDRTNQNKDRYLASRKKDFEYLKELCYSRLPNRYPVLNDTIKKRIEKELEAIKKMDFVSYFLINNDILEYARSKGYPYIGRGSGANSVVAYIIGITNVDPIDLDLYFERFINVYRSSPPDFDIDFSWRDRDDVTRYIFERFENTALMGTYVTFQYKATFRELSKVFGIPKQEQDDYLKGYTIDPKSDKHLKLVEKYSHLIQGFPNYRSVHSGGIIITKNPVHYYTATFMPPKGFQTLQIDMNIAEDVGIYKFDILAQRGLSKIKDTVELIKENQPEAIIEDLDNVYKFKKDPKINDLLKRGDCMGVFYVESPAMRTLMTKLQTQDYLGLVAASSIIRPGVTNGGMKNQYILRHRYPEKRKEAHPVMLKILEDTYGVMVYQEDVLKVAHLFAGLTLAEADILRRGMRGKTRSKGEFEKIEEKFKKNCLKKGYSNQVTQEVWDQIRAFAGYAFAKGHSASYAVESYQSLYLKKYFPLEFMVAVLNNGGGFYNIETYINEIVQCGGIVESPCINESDHPNVIKGKIIYLGFGMIKELESRVIERILTERQLQGYFINFNNFCDRIRIGIEQLIILIQANAFRFTGLDKHHIMWEAHLRFNKAKAGPIVPKLFQEKPIQFKLPEISTNYKIEAYDQLTLFGFPLVSRFRLLDQPMQSNLTAKELPKYNKKRIIIYGNLVTAKGTVTNDKRLMHFGTFIDIDGGVFDTVHFPKIAEKFSIKAKGVYKVIGMVTEDMGFYSITVEQIYYQGIVPDPREHLPENSNKNISLS